MPGPNPTAELRSGGADAQASPGRVGIRRLAAAMLTVAAASNCWFLLALMLRGTLPAGEVFISELAARGQPYSTLFRLADLLTGLTLICGVALGWSRAPLNRWLWAAGAALVGYGLLTATDSLLPLDCPPSWDPACRAAESAGTVSWQHQLHSLTGVLETVALLVVCTGVTLGTRHSRQWWPVHRIASWLMVLQATMALAISILWLTNAGSVGWPQRIATLATSALLATLASRLAVQEWAPGHPPNWPVPDPNLTRQITVPVLARRGGRPRAAGSSRGYFGSYTETPSEDGPALAASDAPSESDLTDQLAVTIYLAKAPVADATMGSAEQRQENSASNDHSSGAPALFLNGLSLPADLWQPVIAAAGPTMPAICFDRPGNGNSTGTHGPDLEAQLAQIRAVLVAVPAATGPMVHTVLVAHSHAALAATSMARIHPELVGGLVLVDPSIPGQPRPIARAAQTALVALLDAGAHLRCCASVVGRTIAWLQLRAGLATPDCHWPPQHLRARMASQQRLRASVAELAIEPEVLLQESALAGRLPLPAIPVTVLASERVGWPTYFRDRGWMKRLSRYASQLQAQGAQVDFCVLPGAHLLLLDTPGEVARNVTEMSQRIA